MVAVVVVAVEAAVVTVEVAVIAVVVVTVVAAVVVVEVAPIATTTSICGFLVGKPQVAGSPTLRREVTHQNTRNSKTKFLLLTRTSLSTDVSPFADGSYVRYFPTQKKKKILFICRNTY